MSVPDQPHPLDADEVAQWKAGGIERLGSIDPIAAINAFDRLRLIATVEARDTRLAAVEKDRDEWKRWAEAFDKARAEFRAQLADAHAVIRRALGSGKPYAGDVWFDMEQADGTTAWRLANHYPPKWEPMTPGETAAIAAARATEGATDG